MVIYEFINVVQDISFHLPQVIEKILGLLAVFCSSLDTTFVRIESTDYATYTLHKKVQPCVSHLVDVAFVRQSLARAEQLTLSLPIPAT